MALDAAAKAERADRIKRLREESPHTQPSIAEHVGVTLRAYQRWEEGGGIEWEHLEKLAELHGVDPQWIHRGQGRGPTPDVLGDLSDQTQLDRIEQALIELRAEVAGLGVELARRKAPARPRRRTKPAADS